MNKNVFWICLLVSAGLTACMKPDQGFVYDAVKTAVPPVIDGVPDEPVWRNTHEITLRDNETGEEITDPGVVTRVRSCYDHEYLYISFVCNDPDIWSYYTHRDDSLWKHEVVEVFINTDETPEGYVELEVSPSNIFFDSYITDTLKIDVAETARFNLEAIKYAVKVDGTLNQREDTDCRWEVEMAVPLKELLEGFSPESLKGKEIRINFYRFNRDLGKEKPGMYAWSPTYGRFHQPARFGVYRFSE